MVNVRNVREDEESDDELFVPDNGDASDYDNAGDDNFSNFDNTDNEDDDPNNADEDAGEMAEGG